MSYETLLYDVADGVATITFNRPDAANAMSPLCARELNEVSIEVEGNSEIRAVILTGAGKMFCAGGDLGAFVAAGDKARSLLLQMTGDLHLGISRLSRNAAPVIGAINGTAAGAGFSMVMLCDLAISAASAHAAIAAGIAIALVQARHSAASDSSDVAARHVPPHACMPMMRPAAAAARYVGAPPARPPQIAISRYFATVSVASVSVWRST